MNEIDATDDVNTIDARFLEQYRKGLEGISHERALAKTRRTLRKIRSGPRGIEKHLAKLKYAKYPTGLEREIRALRRKETALEQLIKELEGRS